MDTLYRDNILDHYKNPRNFGLLDPADAKHLENNPLCGDRIQMQIKCKTQKGESTILEDVKFTGEGCAISIASASMLSEKVKGMELSAIKKLTADDIVEMLGITLTPTRLKCALLALETLQKTIALVNK